MKKLFLIIFILACFTPSPLFADYVDDKLPDDTSVLIKEGARQIIQLGVKRRQVVKITKRMIKSDFEENQLLAAYDVLIAARREGLSEDPLMDKLNEGIAKEVPPEDIIQAMEKVRGRYETASRYAKMLSEDEDHIETMTTEIAECMAAGIDPDDVGQVTKLLKKQSESMTEVRAESLNKRAIRTMKTMARSGVQSQDALGVVRSAFKSGFDAEDMLGLENSFKLNARWSSSVSDLARAYSVAIENGATFNDVDFYDPWTTSFGSRTPGGPGMPGGGIPPGGGFMAGSPPGGPGNGAPNGGIPSGGPPAAPGSSSTAGGGPMVGAPPAAPGSSSTAGGGPGGPPPGN